MPLFIFQLRPPEPQIPRPGEGWNADVLEAVVNTANVDANE